MSDLNTHDLILQYVKWNQFGNHLGMTFSILKPGKVHYRMSIEKEHLATVSAAHGGVIASLMDASLGVAALSVVCQDQKVVSTVSLTIQYLAPAKLGDVLFAEAEVIKSGNRLIFVESSIRNQLQEVVATGMATMNAYPISKLAD
jgi:uncharacterized protein (TIGR00369 family)